MLIPEAVPIVAMWCTKEEFLARECKGEKVVIVGTVQELREWRERELNRVGAVVDSLVTAVSIIFGLILLRTEIG